MHHHGQAQQQQQPAQQEGAIALGPEDFISDAEFEKMFGRVGAEGKLIPVDPKPAGPSPGDREGQRVAGGSDP
jgi:hypothetical protein